jgi:hypothetical protein
MPDNSPRPPGRKRALIAPLVILLTLAAIVFGAFVLQRSRRPAVVAPQMPASAPMPSLAVSAPLERTELVQEANAAAAAYAAGAKPSPDKSPLIGRRFSVRIPFGCGGPGSAGPSAQASVELDAATNALKLSAAPAIWTSLPVLQDLPKVERIETVEGFWIPRPWVNTDACPPVRNTPLPATPTPVAAQTVGLARIFEKGGSRVLLRGDRPYQFSLKLPKDEAAQLGHTYHLVLEGALVGFGDGRALHCWSESPDHRPICLYAVTYDRVAFEDTATGAVLAEWRE